MKGLEDYMNELFIQTKEWGTFYSVEMDTWNELLKQVKKQVIIEHQQQVEYLPSATSVTKYVKLYLMK